MTSISLLMVAHDCSLACQHPVGLALSSRCRAIPLPFSVELCFCLKELSVEDRGNGLTDRLSYYNGVVIAWRDIPSGDVPVSAASQL